MTLPENLVRDAAGTYHAHAALSENDILMAAEAIISTRFLRQEKFSDPEDAERFLVHRLSKLEHEVFAVAFLDQSHRIISFEEMFRGTISCSSVHPREVVKRALALNAAAVVLAHNHPSGNPEPSQADIRLTEHLRGALGLVDVRVIDHVVVGGTETTSMSKRRLI